MQRLAGLQLRLVCLPPELRCRAAVQQQPAFGNAAPVAVVGKAVHGPQRELKAAVFGQAGHGFGVAQKHGAGGLQDPFLAHAYVGARCLRLADGPDEVHIAALARSMLKP